MSGYHYISSPISGATLSQVNSAFPLVNPGYGYYDPNNPPSNTEMSNMWWMDETHSDASLLSQNGWERMGDNLDQSMGTMLGWAFIVNSGINVSISGQGNQLFGVSGLTQPQYNATLTPPPGGYSGQGGNGFHLIGNPFP